MNKKILLLSIIISLVSSFCLATYLYLPHVAIQDYNYSINENDFNEINLNSIDCNAIKKKSFLNELKVADISEKKKSAYISLETPKDQPSELHVIGVYSGTPIVHIEKTESPTTLLLSSSESTVWSVQLENDASINKIYTFGRVKEIRISKKVSRSTISKLKHIFLSKPYIKDIEIIKVSPNNTCRTYGYKWTPDENGKFRYFINTVRKNTQLIEHSFQGLYSFNTSHSPFEIPLKSHYSQHEVPALKNKAAINAKNYPEPITDADELMVFIQDLIDKNIIPGSLPSIEHGSEGRLMKFNSPFNNELPKVKVGSDSDYKCGNRDSVLIEGNDKPNVINCSWGNQVIYAGGGKDLIEDSWGNDIFYGGKGNDVIDAGWGSDIIIFNEGWGSDVVDKTCHHSKYNKGSTIGAADYNYKWKYTNFIVFGPNILSKDIIWDNNKLVNNKTGDTIEFKKKCFNFVYFSEK